MADRAAFRVLVSDPLSPAGLERLAAMADVETDAPDALTRDDLLRSLPEYDALIVRSGTDVNADLLMHGTRLKVVGRAGVGLDNVDVEAATERGVLVMNTPGANATATAEHTWALLLALCRKVPAAERSLRGGAWDRKRFIGTQLHGKTIGLVGLGRVGRLVAQHARAFGMHVVAYDPYLAAGTTEDLDVDLIELDPLFERADVISLHATLNDRTRSLVNRERLARMRPGALLVNCARGGLVDEQALVEALTEGDLGGAALDVFVDEPPVDSPLLGCENVVMTPHLAASTHESQRDVSVKIVDQVVQALRGADFTNAVNLPFVTDGGLAEIRPWLDLGERLGQLAGALAPGRFESLEVETRGADLGPHHGAVTVALLTGLLRPILDTEVNYISVRRAAEERGIATGRSLRRSAARFSNLLACRLVTDAGHVDVAGTLFDDHPRAVEIDGYPLDAPPTGTVLLVWNRDVPGVIGDVGTLLGQGDVNIAEWRLGRSGPGELALAFINLDQPASDETIEALRSVDGVRDVRQLQFPD